MNRLSQSAVTLMKAPYEHRKCYGLICKNFTRYQRFQSPTLSSVMQFHYANPNFKRNQIRLL